MTDRYYFDQSTAQLILDAMSRAEEHIELSVDLHRSRRRVVLQGDDVILDNRNRLHREELQQISRKEGRIYMLEEGELQTLESRGDGYYKLVPTEGAPLLEISGVKMHISKGTDPFTSASKMAALVVKKGDRVLDTCSGLGYAATAAHSLGAREVVTVEINATVMKLRLLNPWSQGLNLPGMNLLHGDIGDIIKNFQDGSFDAVIHDPPRFSLAGELYSASFYREIWRILKSNGRLFHYTGNPHLVKRGSSFIDSAAKRLAAAGFKQVTKVPELMGLSAKK